MASERDFIAAVAQLQALASSAAGPEVKPTAIPTRAPAPAPAARFAHLDKSGGSPRSMSALSASISGIHALCESHIIRDYDWHATGLYDALFSCLALLCSDGFATAEACESEMLLWQLWSYMCSHGLEWQADKAKQAAELRFFKIAQKVAEEEDKDEGEGESRGNIDEKETELEDASDAQEGVDLFSATMPPPARRRASGYTQPTASTSSTSTLLITSHSDVGGVRAAVTAKDKAGTAAVGSLLRRITELSTQNSENMYGGAFTGRQAICVRAAQHLFHWFYVTFVEHRAVMRVALCHCIGTTHPKINPNSGGARVGAIDSGSSRLHVAPLLRLLLAIISGLRSGQSNLPTHVLANLLINVLLPLHTPNEMLDWRDQKPAISSYHSVLTQCMLSVINAGSSGGDCDARNTSNGPSLATAAVNGLLTQWPAGFHANSKKEVLLLHELEALVCACSITEQAVIADVVLRRVGAYVSIHNENIFTTQRTLQMFKRSEFLSFLHRNLMLAYSILIPAMYAPDSGSSTSMSWNPTVNRLTGLALRAFRDLDPEGFDVACDRLLVLTTAPQRERERETGTKRGRGAAVPAGVPAPDIDVGAVVMTASASPTTIAQGGISKPIAGNSMPPKMSLPFPLRHNVPRPPAVNSQSNRSFNPASKMPMPMPAAGASQNRSGMPHPMTRAPWATASAFTPPTPVANSAMPPLFPMNVDTESNIGASVTNETQEEQSGRDLMQAFISRCMPSSSPASAAEDKVATDWNVLQASSTPTLLPTLKFHELVFRVGKPLGTGAFSVVKYARHVTPKCSQSEWPEFAVKTISHAVLTECHYHASVEREMSILRVLAHPGVCRGISFFRYSSAAYIVLEYCSRGDLHSYIIRRSRYVAKSAGRGRNAEDEMCVSIELARFILGEITAALLYVHSLGLAYNDLKPENILITKLGHIKISDFGACRAVTADGRDLLSSVSLSAGGLCGLRSGGWWEDESKNGPASQLSASRAAQENDLWARLPQSSAPMSSSAAPAADNAMMETGNDTNDNRAEGTPAYLPPEVLQNESGGIPGVASDVWALGCLLLFLLTGRPPFCGDRAVVLEQQEQAGLSTGIVSDVDFEYKAVSFQLPQQFGSLVHGATSGAIKPLLNGLLCISPQNRFTLSDVVQHEWLVGSTAPGAGEFLPDRLDPLNLHRSAPPEWPGPWPNTAGEAATGAGTGNEDTSAGEGEEEEEEDPWARRQFSTLWYAMPAPVSDYAARDSDSGSRADAGTGSGSGRVPYALLAVPETDTELSAPFI